MNRFLRFLLFVFALVFSSAAGAGTYPAYSGFQGTDWSGKSGQCPGSTKQGVCSCMTPSATSHVPLATTFYQVEASGMCDYTGSGGPTTGIYSIGFVSTGYYCSGSDVLSGTTCTTSSGSGGTGGSGPCVAGTSSGTQEVRVGYRPAFDLNTPFTDTAPGPWSGTHITDAAGCDAVPKGGGPTDCVLLDAPDSKGYYPVMCIDDFVETGAPGAQNNTPADIGVTSTPSTPNNYSPASPTGQCPAGTVAGTDASGNPACIGTTSSVGAANGGSSTPSPPVAGSAPTAIYDPTTGNTTTTSTNDTMNPDGSITTTTTTVVTLPNGTHTVSSTSTTGNNVNGVPGTQAPAGSGSGGSGSGSSGSGTSGSGTTPGAVATSNTPQPTLCQDNPNLNICKNSTVTGAQCEGSNGVTGFTCTGDAIQCATLQQVADQNCRDLADRTAEQQSKEFSLGNAVMNGQDPLGSTLPTPGNATNVDVGTLSANGFLGGGSCFADVPFSVMGQQITIPFSQVCQYLIFLRGVMMAIAGLVSFKMLSTTFLS